MDTTLSVSQHDWSLHRKGSVDQARHNQKVRESLKDNLADIVSNEAIITSDGKKTIRVPIRSLDLPHFRFLPKKLNQTGQGDGKTNIGDLIIPDNQEGQGPGKGKRAGDVPGIDYYDAEIDLDELAALVFEDLGLPNLQRKAAQETEVTTIKFTDIRRKGPMSNLDKRRTILENIKRNAQSGAGAVFSGVNTDDLRFKTWEEKKEYESNALVIAMRDVSGSMGEFEKYITRSFYFWMVRFLRTKYRNVKIVFITHHTEAMVVEEEAFFNLGESGGTRVSSAYRLALGIIEESFSPSRWNIYPFHFSDGDNFGDADNRLCVELVQALLKVSNAFGYGEIQEYNYGSTTTLMDAYGVIKDPKFIPVVIKSKNEVYPALQKFFSPKFPMP